MIDPTFLPLLRAIGWALLHSLWQGALLALLAAGALRMARSGSAELRYALAMGALGLLVVAFITTLFWYSIEGGPGPLFETSQVFSEEGSPHFGDWFLRLKEGLMPWLPWLSVAWGMGLLFRLVRMGNALAWLYGPCLGSFEPAPVEWVERFETLRIRHHVRIPVRLGLSRRVDSLVVLGWLKPVVLVPAAAMLHLAPDSLEILLTHELAHVRRHDFLANLLQSFAETLLFYHPAAGWLSRRIRQEREHCCDDAAVRACGDPILYASALLALEELRTPSIPPSDLALAARGGHLMSRIQRLLRPRPTHPVALPAAFTLPVLLLAAALTTAALSAATAGSPDSPVSSAAIELETSQVRVKRRPAHPGYPPEAKAQRIQGTVVVRVTIDVHGKVTDAEAMSGPEELRASAVTYAKTWEFEPARVKGKPSPARFKLTMPFHLK